MKNIQEFLAESLVDKYILEDPPFFLTFLDTFLPQIKDVRDDESRKLVAHDIIGVSANTDSKFYDVYHSEIAPILAKTKELYDDYNEYFADGARLKELIRIFGREPEAGEKSLAGKKFDEYYEQVKHLYDVYVMKGATKLWGILNDVRKKYHPNESLQIQESSDINMEQEPFNTINRILAMAASDESKDPELLINLLYTSLIKYYGKDKDVNNAISTISKDDEPDNPLYKIIKTTFPNLLKQQKQIQSIKIGGDLSKNMDVVKQFGNNVNAFSTKIQQIAKG